MKITFKIAKNWDDFDRNAKDYGIYWLSFGVYSTYIGIAFKGETTMVKRWKTDHDYKNIKWKAESAKKKLGKGWTRKINGRDLPASLRYWKYKKPQGIPSSSAASRKKILESLESVLIYNIAKTRHNPSKRYRDIRYDTPTNATLINDRKINSSKGTYIRYLQRNLGNSKLVIVGAPRDWTKFNEQKINTLVDGIKLN